jgi:hypothetical protein
VTLREVTDGVTVDVGEADLALLISAKVPSPPSWLELMRLRSTEEVLVAVRGRFKNVHPGLWSLVVGRSDPTTEDPGEFLVLPLEVGVAPLSIALPAEGWLKASD